MTIYIIKGLFALYLGIWLAANEIYAFNSTWLKWWSLALPLSILLVIV